MGYSFNFPDPDKAHEAVLLLNEACHCMKAAWLCCARTRDFLGGQLLQQGSGAEVFYFETPPKDAAVMARRLCAALRLVAETVYEEKGFDLATELALELYRKTAWSAHPCNAGERDWREYEELSYKQQLQQKPPRYRHTDINVDDIYVIVALVDRLRDVVLEVSADY